MKKDKSLLFVGYKCKGNVKSNYRCCVDAVYLTDKHQDKFISWYREKIQPELDKKYKELKESKE